MQNRLKNAYIVDSSEKLTEEEDSKHLKEDSEPGAANLVTSNIIADLHFPILDIDIPMEVRKSSSGNSHLFINKVLTTEQYCIMLEALTKVGIIQEGFYNAYKQRGYTSVRLPGLTKHSDSDRVMPTGRDPEGNGGDGISKCDDPWAF